MSAPRRIAPRFVERVWGATDLRPLFGEHERPVGEVWHHADGLLIKFLFTTAPLSVQVHPNDDWARRLEGLPMGKTEMWYVMNAAPGARLAAGFNRAVTAEQVRAAALGGGIEPLLTWRDARAGDVFLIPAGAVHALGAGLAVLEIQQPSDITYRLYDYGRPRELHREKGLQVAHLGPHPGPSAPHAAGDGSLELASNRHFIVKRREICGPLVCQCDTVLIVLEGNTDCGGPGSVFEARPGDQVHPSGRSVVVEAYVPASQ